MNANRNPIFILGLMPRCGTNFLSNLLQLHPDCAPANPVWEDFIITHLDKLALYSDAVAAEWDADWGVDDRTCSDLNVALGNGLAAFLEDRCPARRVISKTPRVTNVDLFRHFFPDSKLLILVRDGRAIVESGARTFHWSREAAMHTLADAARAVSRFRDSTRSDRNHYRILRYEDLWQETESQLRKLFNFLELDEACYDWEKALALPVRGSSELGAQEEKSIHWDPVERDADFDPLSRFAEWSDAAHFRYNAVAGSAMEPFGYGKHIIESSPWLPAIRNRILDVAWWLRVFLRPVYHRMQMRKRSVSEH